MQRFSWRNIIVVASTVLFSGACALGRASAEKAQDPPAAVDPTAPIVLSSPKSFDEAVRIIEQATGVQGEKLQGKVALEQGRSFSLDPSVAYRLIEGSHASLRKAGFYLFRYERSFGLGDDQVGLVETSDPNAVIRMLGTSGKRGPSTDKVIAWLNALSSEEPFDLTEIGTDYLAGKFTSKPKNPRALAKRCAKFAPELTSARASTLDLLVNEIEANWTLYLIW